MKAKINNCVGCNTIYGGCMGSACPYHPHIGIVCDECGEEEPEFVFRYKGKDLCIDCLIEHLPRTSEDEECEECGDYGTIYEYDGELLCYECLKKRADDYEEGDF